MVCRKFLNHEYYLAYFEKGFIILSNPLVTERDNLKVGRGDIIIDEVKVDRHIIVKPYECDVKKLNCASLCCMRGCIVTSKEVERLNKHLPEIAYYLGAERRGIIEKTGRSLPTVKNSVQEGARFILKKRRQLPSFWKRMKNRSVYPISRTDASSFIIKRGSVYAPSTHTPWKTG